MGRDLVLEHRMKQRKLAHAYLIVGENREALARKLTAAWVCTGDAPPCGQCSGCRKAAQGIHPDIIQADGRELKAEAVRDLRADAYVRPNEAPRKVYILDHSEQLNPTSQNILLKLIEEGPAYACFLFLSPNPEQLLPTIRSRCETLRASGPEAEAASGGGETLAQLILTGASEAESLSFLVGLEKQERGDIQLLLEETRARLIRALPQRPDLLPVLDRLAPIRAACEFNISAGHLTGWIASIL